MNTTPINSIEVEGAIARGYVKVNGTWQPGHKEEKPTSFILVNGQDQSVEFRLVGEFVRVISKGRDWLAVTLSKEKARKEYGKLLTLGYQPW